MMRVGLVDDHPLYLEGLRRRLLDDDRVEIVAAVASVEELMACSDAPEVVLLDLHLPGCCGADAVEQLVRRGLRVLVLTASSDRDDVLDAMSAGASGYLTKQAGGDEIVDAVVQVSGGGTYVSAALAGYLLRDELPPTLAPVGGSGGSGGSVRTAWPGLSLRERQILELLARGERDEDIAADLCISVHTVRSHLDRIRAKTGRRRRAELTRMVLEQPPTVTRRGEIGQF